MQRNYYGEIYQTVIGLLGPVRIVCISTDPAKASRDASEDGPAGERVDDDPGFAFDDGVEDGPILAEIRELHRMLMVHRGNAGLPTDDEELYFVHRSGAMHPDPLSLLATLMGAPALSPRHWLQQYVRLQASTRS